MPDRQLAKRKYSFSLSSLVVLLTIAAILLAWFADHRKLVEEIGAPPKRYVILYRLSHASPDMAEKQLCKLFPTDIIKHDPKTKSLIISAEGINHDRIAMILRYIDRKGTEYSDGNPQASLPESTAVVENDPNGG